MRLQVLQKLQRKGELHIMLSCIYFQNSKYNSIKRGHIENTVCAVCSGANNKRNSLFNM